MLQSYCKQIEYLCLYVEPGDSAPYSDADITDNHLCEDVTARLVCEPGTTSHALCPEECLPHIYFLYSAKIRTLLFLHMHLINSYLYLSDLVITALIDTDVMDLVFDEGETETFNLQVTIENTGVTAVGDDILAATAPNKNFAFFLQISDVDLSTGANGTLGESEFTITTYTDENQLRVALPNDGTTGDVQAQVTYLIYIILCLHCLMHLALSSIGIHNHLHHELLIPFTLNLKMNQRSKSF